MAEKSGKVDPFWLIGIHAFEVGSLRVRVQVWRRKSAFDARTLPLNRPLIANLNEDSFEPFSVSQVLTTRKWKERG